MLRLRNKQGHPCRQTADLMEEWQRLSEEMPGDPRVVELYGRLSETRRARDQAVLMLGS
jgi:hypothetical protein